MSVRRIALSLLCTVFAAGAIAGEASPSNPKDVIRQTVRYCATGLERLLPGEYYFCAAVRDFGKGHNNLAAERLRDAAYWASKPAQYILGLMYYNGDEGRVNRPLGIAWLAIAAERHDPTYEAAFARAYLESTAEERAQANVYWKDLRENYADTSAGVRAHRRYQSEMRMIEAASFFGGSVFIAGLTPPGDPTGQFGDGTDTSRIGGVSGYSVGKMIKNDADEYFRGMVGTVTVGEVQPGYVAIGQVAGAVRAPR
ncbi:hypothetical protein SAMN02800692_3571 [Luteibacter sp. UNC138MFCol5.1]|uniref:sel1 repeat family protein n=1 Tax=Luteibacter sp. UNC138MFCol5.1 TaxID=1502774 RepID=UPI0008B53911|nr:sel1 repeat family protein [Luteibacter sp. UNC138MFCol5.1]SEP08720.1 hypothetical protein SAMN02800692_3571 [Luteibacter sp. UNC138MFCol5.1]